MTTTQKRRAIKAQIRAKKSIKFTYKDGTRLGNPHTLGTSGDKFAVRLYQTEGDSSTGLKGENSEDDFRFFYLEDIDGDSDFEQAVEFEVHPAFKKQDEAFDRVEAEVE